VYHGSKELPMTASSRRQFMQSSLAAGAIAALGPAAALARQGGSPGGSGGGAGGTGGTGGPGGSGGSGGGKRILILGGTAFIGPATMHAALARGHRVTLFNRGRIEEMRDLEFPAGVEVIHGNRDPEKTADDWKDESKGQKKDPNSPKGLSGLKGKSWDAVIDNSGFYPRIVRASAELLAPGVKQYIFISSVSVYAGGEKPMEDETAAVGTMEDPTLESMGDQFQYYGPLKALCEQSAEAAMPGRVASVRPGLIVGPGDPTDRFTYWPVRLQRGGEVLAPGSPADPVQFIDVRDLAEWLVHMVERATTGVFNAINPAPGALTMGETLDACNRAAGGGAMLTWVDAKFLESQQVSPWGDMPLWIPPEGESAGFHLRSNAAAAKAGLRMRPPEVTARDILNWWPKDVERRTKATAKLKAEAIAAGQPPPEGPDPALLRAGIRPDREKEVLAAWHARPPAEPPAPAPVPAPAPAGT
jgi:2'-hydroxyisoflavone reductase